MSVNLLALANSLSNNNRNNSKTLQKVASKGRNFGGVKDSKLRKVKGELSHVNKVEADAIDWLGPLGEAWVAKIGSGTINPKTGLREYGLFKSGWFSRGGALSPDSHSGSGSFYERVRDGATWRPMDGKWGWFGQTSASERRQEARRVEAERKRTFDTWISEHKDEDVSKYWLNNTAEDWITGGTPDDATDASTMKKTEYDRFINAYDERKEDETAATLDRELESHSADIRAAGNEVAGANFGLLTTASALGAQQGFAGAGNFGQEMQQEQMMDAAKTDQDKQNLTRESLVADATSATQDIRDDFNADFWKQMTNWNSAKKA